MTAGLGCGRRSVAGALAVCFAFGASAYGQEASSWGVPNGGGEPVSAVVAANVPLLAAPPHDGTKNRYISFNPNNGATPVAFEVTLLGPVTVVAWVGEPVLRSDTNNTDPQWVSDLVTSPVGDGSDHVRDWSSYTDPATGANVVHIRGCAIFPDQSYDIRALDPGGALTNPVTFDTTPEQVDGRWADCVGVMDVGSGLWTGPNGVTNVNDLAAAIASFQQRGLSPVTWTDLTGEVPNYIINFSDVVSAIKGFTAVNYWDGVSGHGSVADCVTPPP